MAKKQIAKEKVDDFSTTKSPEELVALAGRWEPGFGGYGRDQDGILIGWHDWAASHPQLAKNDGEDVLVCQGREEWKKICAMERINAPPQKTEPFAGNSRFHGGFSIVSWNILSDTWCSMEGSKTYAHTPKEHGVWEGRFPLFLRWIRVLHPDVLALQEVDFCRFSSHVLPELQSMGYDGRMQSQKKQNANQPCGVATFWRTDKFHLDDEAPAFSRSMGIVLELVDAPAGATATCTHSNSNNKICVVNIHLESSQTRVGADRRARQLNSPLQWASNAAPGCPLVLCGDCNTGADSALFDTLRKYKWHGHGLASVYEHPATAKTLPVNQGTFLVPNRHYVIDHVLYSHDELQLTHVLDALSPQEREEHVGSGFDKGFPSSFCPSDHIPVGAVFGILESNKIKEATELQQQRAVLDPARRAVLEEEWKALRSEKPTHSRGKPSLEEIEKRRAYAKSIREWKKRVAANSVELAFVNDLVKRDK